MKYIRDLKENETVVSFCSVRSKQIKSKRNGEPYVELVLADRSGQIPAKIWDDVDLWRNEVQEGDFVKYKGRIQMYSGSRQLIVEKLRKVTQVDKEEGFCETEVIPSTEYDVGAMWSQLLGLIDTHCKRPCVIQLLHNVLEHNRDKVMSYPAGAEIHHNYWGGFLEHVLSVVESALYFSAKYPSLDSDLLVAGAVLHDIGKLEEFASAQRPTYTTKGILIGHVVLGRDMVRDEALKIPDFPPDLLLLLEHMILSHQGQLQWGAPKEPKTPEALVLHYIDDIDAKLNRMLKLVRDDPGDSEFTPFDKFLGRSVFKGPSKTNGVAAASPAKTLRLVPSDPPEPRAEQAG